MLSRVAMGKDGQWLKELYYGDNLDVLRKHISDESVDLIYLEPPFNSNRSYNVFPEYVRGPVRVVGKDVYDLDRDGDGVGCDS